ncbi:37919_t:CDS:2, partial [Gigaspora margarita]
VSDEPSVYFHNSTFTGNLVRTGSIGGNLNLSNKVPKRKIDNEKNDDIKEERASKRNRPQSPENETKVDLSEFEREYSKMNKSDKWTLYWKSGRRYTLQFCLCHSFVIDPNDKIYVNEGVFTEFELDEIKKYKFKPLPQMPQGLLTYLHSFRVYDLLDLRKEILKTQQWDSPYNQKTHFDHNWIRNTMLYEYETGSLEKEHLEL